MAEPPDETEDAETEDAIYECALAELLADPTSPAIRPWASGVRSRTKLGGQPPASAAAAEGTAFAPEQPRRRGWHAPSRRCVLQHGRGHTSCRDFPSMLTARQHGGAERSHAPPGRVATQTAHAKCVHHQAAAQAGWRDRRHRSAVHPAQQTWPSRGPGRRHARRRRRDATPGEPWASAWRSAHVSPPPAPLYARLHAWHQ